MVSARHKMLQRTSKSVPQATRTRPRSMRSNAFTLIEVMIVLAILSIIVGIAYPGYFDQVRKSRRADAVSSLMDKAQLMERCVTRFYSYTADGCIDPEGPSPDGYYVITVARDASSFTLTATPTGTQSADRCGAFTLDYLGNNTPTPDENHCWGSS